MQERTTYRQSSWMRSQTRACHKIQGSFSEPPVVFISLLIHFGERKVPRFGAFFGIWDVGVVFFSVLTCEDDQDLEASSNLGVWFGFTTSMTKVIPCYTELCRVIHLWSFEDSFPLGFSLKLCKRPSGSTSRRKKERCCYAWKVGRI